MHYVLEFLISLLSLIVGGIILWMVVEGRFAKISRLKKRADLINLNIRDLYYNAYVNSQLVLLKKKNEDESDKSINTTLRYWTAGISELHTLGENECTEEIWKHQIDLMSRFFVDNRHLDEKSIVALQNAIEQIPTSLFRFRAFLEEKSKSLNCEIKKFNNGIFSKIVRFLTSYVGESVSCIYCPKETALIDIYNDQKLKLENHPGKIVLSVYSPKK